MLVKSVQARGRKKTPKIQPNKKSPRSFLLKLTKINLAERAAKQQSIQKVRKLKSSTWTKMYDKSTVKAVIKEGDFNDQN